VAGDRVRELDARRRRSRYYWVDGQGRRAEEETLAAIEGLEQLPPSPELALAYAYHSQVLMLMPDFHAAIPEARRAIEVADRVGSIEAKVHALNNLGVALIGVGDEQGVADLRESLRLALEHNLPDDVGRAYANLSNQGGAGVSLFPPEEAEPLFDEMLAYDERVVPEGVFHQWHREARAELWFGQGRWAEAEAALRAIVDSGANRYMRVNAGSYLALVLGFRGRYRDAVDVTDSLVEVAVTINDLQAYAPMLMAAAHAARGAGDPEGAVDRLEHCLRLRGTTVEHDISTFFLFEGTDVLGWLHGSAEVDRRTVERGLELLRGLVDHLDATAPSIGLPSVLAVRTAIGDAARLHLRRLNGEPGDGEEFRRAMTAHAAQLRAVARPFDAARVDLWLSEFAGDGDARDRAEAAFAELRAQPYLERIRTRPR
jgi:tetratricopeptide (TPR) repeat protein